VEWRDAPLDHERQKFEIEDTRGSGRGDTKLLGGIQREVPHEEPFNPNDRPADTLSGRPGAPNGPAGAQGIKGGKRDLKKLSEWLKLMRALEERKKNGEADE